jgi:hypothetical protein
MNNPQARPLFNIAQMLPGLPRLKIVDVGAMSLGEGTDAYSPLTSAAPCDVYGFEPVAEEFAKLTASAKPGHHYLPYFVGDGSARTFHECNFAMTSSLYEPNSALLAKFQNLEELARDENLPRPNHAARRYSRPQGHRLSQGRRTGSRIDGV